MKINLARYLIAFLIANTSFAAGIQSNFLQGLAVATANNKYGYIDKSGKWVIEPFLSGAFLFNESGLAQVKLNDKWGFIDKSGEWKIEPKYLSVSPFNNGVAVVAPFAGSGEPVLVIDNNDVTLCDLSSFPKRPDGAMSTKWRFATSFSTEGLAVVEKNTYGSHLAYGYSNSNCNIEIPPKFTQAFAFTEGLAAAKPLIYTPRTDKIISDERNSQPDKFGYIDVKGEWVIQPKYDKAQPFDQGIAKVLIENKYAWIDHQGNFVIGPKFNVIYSDNVKNGLILFQPLGKDSKYGYMAIDGKVAMQPEYDDAKDFSEGLASVMVNGKWGFVNTSGKVVIQPKYLNPGFFSEGLAGVTDNFGNSGFINKKGEWALSPKYLDNTLIKCSKAKCNNGKVSL